MLKGFWKTKQGRLLLLAEAVVLLLLLGITVFHKNDVIRISAKQYSVSGGTYDAASCWCIASEHTDTPFVTIGPLCLDRGVYRVVLPYGEDTAGDSLICVAEDGVTTGVYTNGATLYHGRSSTSFQMWVLKPVDTLTLQVLYSGNGSLLVGDLDIVETSGLYRGILVIVFLLMLALNLVVSRMVQGRFPVQAVGVLVITALASIPLCKNYTISGGDLIFHLMRIEGVKDGLLSGQFPVRIAPKWLCGYGYASSVFYGEILLYFPALLRLAGFSVQAAYKMLLFAINLGTAFISYDCFTKIAKDKWTGLIAALLYTLSPDRLFSQYVYAALGRAGAMMFLPFIALGFYQLYTRETEDADYWKGGVFLTLGFSGLIQTHSLSGMITVIFSVLLCALLALRTFRKKTLAVIGGAAGITLLLNAWFIVPFLDFVRRGDFIMEHTSERTIQSVGLPFSQLMGLFIRRGSDATRDHFGVLNNGQPSVGFPLVAGLLVFAVLWIKGKKVMAKWAVPVLAILGMYMSLLVFPWDAIQSFCAARPYLHSVAAFIANIQFPMRLLMPATILLTVLFCMNAGDMGSCFKEKARRGYLVVFTVLGLICGLFLTEDILQSSPYFRIYNEEGMNYGYVSGGEYLPTGSDLGRFVFGTAMPGSSDVTIAAYEKDDLEVQMQVENKGSDSFVDVPILCYPGYEAVSSHHGTLALTQGDYGQIRVEIPAGFSGDVKVGFHTPWYWIMADLVTLITMVLLAGYYFRRKPLSGETV